MYMKVAIKKELTKEQTVRQALETLALFCQERKDCPGCLLSTHFCTRHFPEAPEEWFGDLENLDTGS